MTAAEWIQVVGLGMVCGLIGQGVRVVAGLKKLHDKAAMAGSTASPFAAGQLLVSLLIGATAGALGAVGLDVEPGADMASDTLVTLIGIGYAGADFIEAFMRRASERPTT
jgi:hypothetical protein